MESNREKVSYCIGLEAGKNIKNQFKDIDHELLKKGFQDAVGDRTPALADLEIKNILQALSQQIQMQQRAFVLQVSEKNRKEGEAFLSDNKQKPGVVALPSGLQYKVLSAGQGTNSPTLYDTVSIHCRGTFLDGTVFESTYERGEPGKVPLNRVIQGWAEALKMMKVGDKWQLFVPSYLAYGENGFGQHIEPNTTLIFEIELVGING